MCESWEKQVKNAGAAVNTVIDSLVAKGIGIEVRGGIGFALDTLLVESQTPVQALTRAVYAVLGDNPPQKTVGYPDENASALREAFKAHDEFAVIDALAARLKAEAPESKELIVSMLAESYFGRVMRAAQKDEPQDPLAALQALFAAAVTGDTSDETDEQEEDLFTESEEDESDDFDGLDLERQDGENEYSTEYSGVSRL